MIHKLENILEKNKEFLGQGHLATYIPALAMVDPNKLGISLMYAKGDTFNVGDYDLKFSIQSISKVISLILALRDIGEEALFSKVGYEASDEPFNTMYKLDFDQKPPNPMINSGAILTTSLIKGQALEKFDRLLELTRDMANNPSLDYDREIYKSEKETGFRNYSMAYLMKSKGYLEGNLEDALDNYFKQCSILVSTLDLANIGIFIARGCPFKEEGKTPNERISRIVTTIMFTCGMYNFSTEYGINVGIATKSGVGGGLLGVIPNKLAIGVYGPELDQKGNSVLGYHIMKDLSKII